MSRVQLALNVADLESSIEFYSKLFNVTAHKVRPGYANFEVAQPPLKLVLIEQPEAERGSGTQGALNHLGIEVETTAEVAQAAKTLAASGVDTVEEIATTCCFAEQDKVWVFDPAGAPWEVYTVTNDNPEAAQRTGECLPLVGTSAGGCC